MTSNTQQIAAKIRTDLKKAFPKYKFSVRTTSNSITVRLMAADFQPIKDGRGNFTVQPYVFENETYDTATGITGVVLTAKGWEVMAKVCRICQAYNWDKSDMQSDYFNVNFYATYSVGDYGNPFVYKGK